MDRLGVKLDHLSADYVHAAVEATKRGFMIRDRYITDPARMTVDPQSLLAPDLLDAMAAKIDMARAAPWGAARPGRSIWMGVIDGAGNAVSMIQSVYHEFGAGVVLRETGINWQNRGASFSLDPAHINTLEPGRSLSTPSTPRSRCWTTAASWSTAIWAATASRKSQSAVFTRTAVLGLNPQDAIAAPRWLLGRTWASCRIRSSSNRAFPPPRSRNSKRAAGTTSKCWAITKPRPRRLPDPPSQRQLRRRV